MSRCRTKRRMGAHGCVHPSFGMTLTFQKKKKNSRQKNLESWCHTKRRMGMATHAHSPFGITTTQAIIDLFAKRSPIFIL